MKVTHLDARYAGSVHDSFAFKSSRLYIKAELCSYENFFLLGDSGYVNNNQQQTKQQTKQHEKTSVYHINLLLSLAWFGESLSFLYTEIILSFMAK